MKYPVKKLVLLGVFIELLILIFSYLKNPSLDFTFRYAARYSGRLSLMLFLIAFYNYAKYTPKPFSIKSPLKKIITLFAVLHGIHFIFLALSVYLNNIPLEFIKVLGGFIAYLMILIAPFMLSKVKSKLSSIYFYYVSLVMVLTYVARIKGDFEGAEPFWFHYLALSTVIICVVVFSIMIRRKN